jgi:nucleoside 2-deoxyribosyltransferase
MQTVMDEVPRLSPPEKMNALLVEVAKMVRRINLRSEFMPGMDYPLIGAEDDNEVTFLADEMVKREFLTKGQGGYGLTVRGWERLEEIQKSGRSSNLAFVAMMFAASSNAVYEKAIAPAIKASGYEPFRVDKTEHVNRIDDEIIAGIRRSRFMVADFTGQRSGVYFEAGMMLGLGRNVIWMCTQKELAENAVHFDVRQFNFIAYESEEDAHTRLINRILAIEGEGSTPQTVQFSSGSQI